MILARFNSDPIYFDKSQESCRKVDIILSTLGKPYKARKKAQYYNVPCSFDIETTSFFRHRETGEVLSPAQHSMMGEGKRSYEKEATMYIWMFGLNGFVIYGRTWDEFIILLQYISAKLLLSVNKRLVCFIHNLSFEFQWFKNWIPWAEVFATKPYEPLNGLSTWGFEFHCSYRNSNKSLDLLGKDLIECKVQKLVGDLDYDLIRNSKTVLSNKELAYCFNDVKVVMAYIHEQLMVEKYVHKIPLTSTGYVRRDLKEACFTDPGKKGRVKYWQYHDMMKDLTLVPDVYWMLKDATQGGFVHGSPLYMGEILKKMRSMDKASYYPSIMVGDLLPMSSFKKRNVHTMSDADFTRYISKYCCLFEVKFEGLESTFPYDDYIAKARCYTEGEVVVNNGRIHKADMIITTITEQDFFIIKAWYKWEKMSISKFYTAWKGHLPKPIVEKILDYFEKKTTLKGVEGPDAEAEYMNSKARINSIFGCTITSIINKEITLSDSGEWKIDEHIDIEEAMQKYNNNPGRFLYWAWGCWVTAIGRRGICAAITNLGADYVYSDTDSVKFLNFEKHKAYFDEVNEKSIDKIKKALAFHKIDPERCHACTPKGDIKYLGIFEDEGAYKRFKTLGAKRYAYEDAKGLHTTVAGLGKKAGIKYLTDNYKDPMKGFDTDLTVPALQTGKLTHTYIDCEMEGELTDYQGHTAHYKELSGVHLAPCPFSMKVTEEYVKFCQALKYRGGELSYL